MTVILQKSHKQQQEQKKKDVKSNQTKLIMAKQLKLHLK